MILKSTAHIFIVDHMKVDFREFMQQKSLNSDRFFGS